MHVVANAACYCLAVSLTASSALAARATQASPPSHEAAPSPTAPTTSPTTADLVALLARALGRELRVTPAIEPIDAPALAKVVAGDIEAASLAGGASADEAAGLATSASRALRMHATRLVAYYSHQTKKVYVNPAAMDMLVEAGAIPKDVRERVVTLTVTHELMHAIQDQEIGLAKFVAIPKAPASSDDVERLSARRAVAEGQAMLAAELVGEALVERDATWKSAIEAARKIAPGALDSGGNAERQREARIYRGGEYFMRKRFATGGADATWDAFRNPPTSLLPFHEPQASSADARGGAIAAALEKFGDSLTAPWESAAKSAPAAEGLASQLSTLPKAEREQVVADCRAMAALGGKNGDAGRLLVLILEATDDEAAKRLDAALAAMQRSTMKALGLTLHSRLTTTKGALLTTIVHEDLTARGTPLVCSFLHGRKGRWIVEVTSMNAGHDSESLQKLAETSLAEVEAIDGKK